MLLGLFVLFVLFLAAPAIGPRCADRRCARRPPGPARRTGRLWGAWNWDRLGLARPARLPSSSTAAAGARLSQPAPTVAALGVLVAIVTAGVALCPRSTRSARRSPRPTWSSTCCSRWSSLPLLVLSRRRRRPPPRPHRFLRIEHLNSAARESSPARIARAHPVPLAVAHTATLWSWHASAPYELALRNDLVHRVEHPTFLLTALASWAALVPVLRRHHPPQVGTPVLVLFALSVQSSILGALLTFARPLVPVLRRPHCGLGPHPTRGPAARRRHHVGPGRRHLPRRWTRRHHRLDHPDLAPTRSRPPGTEGRHVGAAITTGSIDSTVAGPLASTGSGHGGGSGMNLHSSAASRTRMRRTEP